VTSSAAAALTFVAGFVVSANGSPDALSRMEALWVLAVVFWVVGLGLRAFLAPR
jgi:hypothetical protein